MERWACRDIEAQPRHRSPLIPWLPAKGLCRSRARPKFEGVSRLSRHNRGGPLGKEAKTKPEQGSSGSALALLLRMPTRAINDSRTDPWRFDVDQRFGANRLSKVDVAYC
jgi:hypothetical protein